MQKLSSVKALILAALDFGVLTTSNTVLLIEYSQFIIFANLLSSSGFTVRAKY